MTVLPKVEKVYKVPTTEGEFDHYDFMWHLDAKTLVYDDIIINIKDLQNKQ